MVIACILLNLVAGRIGVAATFQYAGISSAASNAWNVAETWAGAEGGYPNGVGHIAETASYISPSVYLYLNEDITLGTLNWSGSFFEIRAGVPKGKFIVDNGGTPATWRIHTRIFFWLNPDLLLKDDLRLSISNSAGYTTWPEPVSLTGVISGPGKLVLDVPVPVLNTLGIGVAWNAVPNSYTGGTRLIGHPSGKTFFEPKKIRAFGTGDLELDPSAILILRNRAAYNDYIADDAALWLETEGTTMRSRIQLDAGLNETVGQLCVDGVQLPPGTYGATGSPADETLDDFLTGPGILTVLQGPDSPGSVRNLHPEVADETRFMLRGEMVEHHSTPTEAYIFWGPQDGGRSFTAWSNAASAGTMGNGIFGVPIDWASRSEPCYYRCFLTNSLGGRWAGRSAQLALPIVTNELPIVREECVRLRAGIAGPDNPPTTLRVYWGTSNGGTDASAWSQCLSLGTLRSGGNSAEILSIQPDTIYFFRAHASNELGEAWSPRSDIFKTPGPPVFGEVTFCFASDLHYGFTDHVPTSAELASGTLDRINAIPGQPYPASIGGGFVDLPRGVILIGDETDTGTAQQWKAYTNDWGLNGDRRLSFPVYEGFGNHDAYQPLVAEFIKARNPLRKSVTNISRNGYHYSWDWDSIHMILLNLFPGNETDPGYPAYSPKESLNFLKEDLAENVADSGRPVITIHHFGMDDLTRGYWWSKRQQDEYYEAIKDQNIIAILSGHNHALMLLDWNGFLHCTDATIGKFHGTFFVARITQTNITLIERTSTGEWGAKVTRPISLPSSGAQSIVLSHNSWRYSDAGEDPGADWKDPDYDDSSWAVGLAPLGFGNTNEATVIGPDVGSKPLTSYFRQSFSAPDTQNDISLSARLRSDDGAVVYLNGVEVYRHNLPAGEIAYQTSALTPIEGENETVAIAFDVPGALLRPGSNVVAIEVHQYTGSLNPVAYWSFDEDSAPWRDTFGGNDLVPTGANIIPSPGRVFGCVSNNASLPDFLEAADTPDLRFSGPFTTGGWLSFGLASGDDRATTALEKPGEFRLYYSGAAVNRYRFKVGDREVQDLTPGMPSGQWRFVVAWYDGANAFIQVDNGPVSSVSATPPSPTTNPIVALKKSGFLGGFATDEVFFFKRVLSASERAALHQHGLSEFLTSSVEDLTLDFELTALTAQRPQLAEAPTSLVRRAGQNAAFRLTAASSSPVTYQWLFNGLPIPEATSTLLFLQNVAETDAGWYALVASNLGGAVTSAPARLTVVSAPIVATRWLEDRSGIELSLPLFEMPGTLLVSTNLIDWEKLQTFPPGSGVTNWVENLVPNSPSRFFRLQLDVP